MYDTKLNRIREGLADAFVMITATRNEATAHDLAEGYWSAGGTVELPEECYGVALKRLPEVVKVLRGRGLLVCLVAETYFDGEVWDRDSEEFIHRDFPNEPPENMAEAALCIAQGKKGVGIRLAPGKNDLILKADLIKNFISGDGKIKHAADDLLEGVAQDKMDKANAGEVLVDSKNARVPENEVLAIQCIQEYNGEGQPRPPDRPALPASQEPGPDV